MEIALALLLKYKYLLIFPLSVFEGQSVSLVLGFLLYKGMINFWLAFPLLFLGDIIPDAVLYYIGYYGCDTKIVKKYVLDNKLFKNHLDVINKLWTEHARKTMFLGKLAYGMAAPFLISAGVVRMPFKKFFSYAIVVSIIQYGIIVVVGYLLGNSYVVADYYLDSIYLIFASIVILLFVAYFFIIKYARKKMNLLIEEEKNEQKQK